MAHLSHRLLLQIPMLVTPVSELLQVITDFILHSKSFVIFTPNPEILLEAQKNKKLYQVLKQNKINIPDGEGVAFFLGIPAIKGRVCMLDILGLLNIHAKKVYVVGSSNDVIDTVLVKLRKDYPLLTIDGSAGPSLNMNAQPINKYEQHIQNQLEQTLTLFQPDMIFVGFGAPKQELWTDRIKSKFPSCSFMVVGGALDTYSGKKSLAPTVMVNLKLEWLYRLLIEPKRMKRIYHAVILFPISVLLSRLTKG